MHSIIGQLDDAPTGGLKFSILEDFQICAYNGDQCKKLDNSPDVHGYRPRVKQHEKDIRFANATGTYNPHEDTVSRDPGSELDS